MSATNRGADRAAFDNYPTPSWVTRRILEALLGGGLARSASSDTMRLSAPAVLEPCVGEGAIVRVVQAMLPRARIVGSDIRDVCELGGVLLFSGADATKPLGFFGPPFDLLITNPPFSVAHEIIQAQRNTARVAAYLLRSSFIAGERAEAYRHDMPNEYRLPNRPNFVQSVKCKGGEQGGILFVACGWAERYAIGTATPKACPACQGPVQRSTSDASEYSWFVWNTSRRSVGESRILPSTPASERQKG